MKQSGWEIIWNDKPVVWDFHFYDFKCHATVHFPAIKDHTFASCWADKVYHGFMETYFKKQP